MAPGQGRRRSKLASPPAPPPRTPHACAVLDACGPHACRQPSPSRCHAASRRTRPGCCCCSTWTKTRCGGGWVGWGVSGWGAHAACAAGGQCPRRPGPSASGVPCLGWLIRCKASTLPACSHKPLPVRRVPCRLPSLAPPHETVASHATSIKTAGGHPLPLLSPNIKPALFPAVCGADSHLDLEPDGRAIHEALTIYTVGAWQRVAPTSGRHRTLPLPLYHALSSHPPRFVGRPLAPTEAAHRVVPRDAGPAVRSPAHSPPAPAAAPPLGVQGGGSLPRLYIEGRFVGGPAELAAMDAGGDLERLLARRGFTDQENGEGGR